MEEKEIMTNEIIEETTETNESSGISTFVGVLIGTGLTIAGIAIGKTIKKVIANRKAKTEESEVIELDPSDYSENEDEDSED